jgi:hypothetical protein
MTFSNTRLGRWPSNSPFNTRSQGPRSNFPVVMALATSRPLDPPVHLGVVLARDVVIEPLRPRLEGGEPFQQRFLALVQAGLVVDHEDADRDVLAAAWLIASYTSPL